jgi:DNA-binding CsgD family transcriptional regulator
VAETLHAVPLIGRQRQLDVVRGWIADLVAGRGRAVLVEGEPGIGKSSLLRTAAREAAAAGCRVLWGTCDELSRAFPLVPLLDTLDARARSGGGAHGSIAEILRAEATPGNRVDLVATAAERLLARVDDLCAAAPVLLVVDDLQWADPATVMTLGRLARSARQLPLLLVGIARPVPRREDLAVLRRVLEPAGQLCLESLSGDEVAEFLSRAVGADPGERLLRLAEGAAGNPLYLTELVDALVRGRALVVDEGRAEATGDDAPSSLAGAIADRLEFLTKPTRDVLRAAALLGADFSVSELAVVCGRRVGELLPVLDEAILAGVLLDDGAELTFRHTMIRAALYESLAPAVRAAWHRDAARALAEDGAPADRVARQLLPALDLQQDAPVDDWVVRWLADAGQQLVGRAPTAAVALLRWAVNGVPAGVTPHDLLTCRLADALYRIGDQAAGAEVAAGALAHVTQPDLLVDLHWTLAQCRAIDGRYEESVAALGRALKAPGVRPRDRARLLVLTARAHRGQGRVDAAARVAEAALAAATEADDRWAMAWSLGTLMLAHAMRGRPAEALPLVDRALAVAQGDPALADLRLMLQINQAVALGDLDRYDEAIGAAQQVRQLADDAGSVVRVAQAQSVLGELLFDVGRWDDALAELEPLSDLTEDPTVGSCDHGVAAAIQLHRDDPAAGQHLTDGQRYAERLGDRVIGTLTLARSLEREQADEPAQALAVLMDGMSDTVEEIEATTALLADAARLAVAVGDEAAARTVVDRAEAVARASDVPHRRAVAPHCRGLLEHDPARLLAAAELYRTAGRPLPRAQALEAAGVALADGGDVTGARTHFTDAFSLYTRLGAAWDLARTQATFRAYGIRRGPHNRHRRSRRGWDSLTPTEMRVVGLVARGMSNPQIAAQLFLSRRTVQTHVSHILAKLDLSSRIDIAREASRREQARWGGSSAPARSTPAQS